MGSGAMIYIPSYIQIGSVVQKLTGGIHRHRDNMDIFENKGSRLKVMIKKQEHVLN
jgi:hypothetical protein